MEPVSAAASRPRRGKRLVAAGIFVLAIVAAAVAAVQTIRGPGASGAIEVETAHVTRRTIATFVKATGVIKPRVGAEVRVGSRVSGVVNHLYVKVGDNVAAGQRLAELDDRDLAARRDQAAADVQRCIAELRYAEADLRRKRVLRDREVISSDDLELAERGGAVAEQQLAVARANLAFAATQLGYAQISAPIAGVVASVATQEGETVAASFSAPTFVTLIDLDRLEVWAYVDETDIGRIDVGQTARFTVDTYADQDFEGRVTAIYPKAEIRDNVVDYVTVLRFEPAPGRTLRPDMTTTVRIAVQERADVLTLPAPAVRIANGRAFVRLRHGGTIERRAVVTGARDETAVEIRDGLREGDEVLLGDANLIGDNPP